MIRLLLCYFFFLALFPASKFKEIAAGRKRLHVKTYRRCQVRLDAAYFSGNIDNFNIDWRNVDRGYVVHQEIDNRIGIKTHIQSAGIAESARKGLIISTAGRKYTSREKSPLRKTCCDVLPGEFRYFNRFSMINRIPGDTGQFEYLYHKI